mgnify:CR=1 FL=1
MQSPTNGFFYVIDRTNGEVISGKSYTSVNTWASGLDWSAIRADFPLLERTVEKLKSLPMLLVITYRPEFNAPWVGESHVTTINLNRLGNREAHRPQVAAERDGAAREAADLARRSRRAAGRATR